MIKFFRKIRQNLLSEGKTGKYLKYAVGEIILVVIGILIALQINNWNEKRKFDIKEIANLKSLKSELITTLEELKDDYTSNKLFHKSTLKVQSYLKAKPVITDAICRDFFLAYSYASFFPKISTYETFKSGNLDLIQSDSLRVLITDVYEAGYKRIIAKQEARRSAANILFPYYQEHFKVISNSQTDLSMQRSYLAIPNNYEQLINDPKYQTLISEALMRRGIRIRDFEETIEMVEEVILKIEEYLKEK
jgi:hypothetical protein